MKLLQKEYDAIAAVRRSDLEEFRRSPAHLQARKANPKTSDAMEFGSALHAAVLEPLRFSSEFVQAPVCNRATKAGKEAWAEFLAHAGTRTVVEHSDYETIRAMTAVITSRPHVAPLLEKATMIEESLVWDHSGLQCKARLDAVCPEFRAVLDLKTTADASPEAFQKSIYNFGYHRQAAFYLMAAEANGLPFESFIIIAAEKEPPFGVAVYRLDDAAVQEGRSEILRLLEKYRECIESNRWPCYPEKILDISIPRWGFKDFPAPATVNF